MAVVGVAVKVITTVSDDDGHGELAIVHCRVYTPATLPVGVNVVVGLLTLANWLVRVDGPETTDQVPEPKVGVLAASVAGADEIHRF